MKFPKHFLCPPACFLLPLLPRGHMPRENIMSPVPDSSVFSLFSIFSLWNNGHRTEVQMSHFPPRMWGKTSLVLWISALILPLVSTSEYLLDQVLFSTPTHISVTPSILGKPVASGWRGAGAPSQNSSFVSRGGRPALLFSRVSAHRNSGYASHLLL